MMTSPTSVGERSQCDAEPLDVVKTTDVNRTKLSQSNSDVTNLKVDSTEVREKDGLAVKLNVSDVSFSQREHGSLSTITKTYDTASPELLLI